MLEGQRMQLLDLLVENDRWENYFDMDTDEMMTDDDLYFELNQRILSMDENDALKMLEELREERER